MRCVNCDARVSDDATTCRYCGGDPRTPETLRNRIEAVRKQAEDAAAAGRTVFVMRRAHRYALGRSGENLNRDNQVARALEAVEGAGWRLDQMSHYVARHRATLYEMSVYVFKSSSRTSDRRHALADATLGEQAVATDPRHVPSQPPSTR